MTQSIIDTAAAEATARFDMLTLDPRELIRAALQRVTALQYPSVERAQKAAQLIREIPVYTTDLLTAWDVPGIRRWLGKFEHECSLLARPLPKVTFLDDLAAKTPAMNHHGWTSQECDMLAAFAAAGANGDDRIVAFTAASVTLASGRVVSRSEIRAAMRPAWQRETEWRDSSEYKRLVSAEASAIAAEQRARDLQRRATLPSSGPAHLLQQAGIRSDHE
jgi:hypothetical protein